MRRILWEIFLCGMVLGSMCGSRAVSAESMDGIQNSGNNAWQERAMSQASENGASVSKDEADSSKDISGESEKKEDTKFKIWDRIRVTLTKSQYKKKVLIMACGLCAVVLLMAVVVASGRRRKKKGDVSDSDMLLIGMGAEGEGVDKGVKKSNIGQVHHIGRRQNQQDAFGIQPSQAGILAVVSDGMGGLADGDKISREAVLTMMDRIGSLVEVPGQNPLYFLLKETSQRITHMLGPDKLYKCGATLLAVLIQGGGYHWLAVGDSRIYQYCAGHLFQINQEHIYKRKLMEQAVNQEIDFQRAMADPQKNRLTSFLGMGKLECIDGSLRQVRLMQGDKLLLMTDGVFNTLPEEEIIRILESTKNAEEAARLLERRVLAAGNPKQDNFTCIILDF